MPDTFFKILGGTDPLNQSLGDMTQGIGYPLRPVEPSVSAGSVDVIIETALLAGSLVDQLPVGLGTPLQITFGDAQTTPQFDLDVLGNMTCLAAGDYSLRAKFVGGRRGASAGTAQLYFRALLNGTPVGDSSHIIVDNPDTEIPFDFEANGTIALNDVLTFEVVRDTDANDSGGLYAGVPSVAGWNSSPSARILISRFVAVTP